MHENRPRIVVVGAGFGGLEAARNLAKLPAQITLIDRKNHHTFQPLLYQVATAGISPGEIAAPIRWILRGRKNLEVLMDEVVGFDLDRKIVQLSDLEVPYDYLVVAAGAQHSYFGHDEWEPMAPGLKTVEDALEIRRRVLLAFELAEKEVIAGQQPQPMLSFVIVGGGPTGVELAGTLAEIAHRVLRDEFRSIDPERTRILLLEGGPRILPAYAPDLSASAVRQLQKPLGKKLGAPTDRAGRVLVNPDMTLPNHSDVFVIGDLATLKDKQGNLLPGVAPVAMQEGRYVAKAIGRDLQKSMRKPFHYVDKGSLATIGRAAAVAQFRKLHISGYFAWLAWLFVHIFFLIGFRNRLIVLIQWAWSYFTYERGARLITGDTSLPGWPNVTTDSKTAMAASKLRDNKGSSSAGV
ncbi:MAG: FAD-dependent oxidoreductase [Acidobacteria bacterium 13_1_20CM_4_56_7]|nr:MAG: FAD-dependent oxidoreductase [Acidobacteria bacterium 13_1_20CM_4_56_7]